MSKRIGVSWLTKDVLPPEEIARRERRERERSTLLFDLGRLRVARLRFTGVLPAALAGRGRSSQR